MGIIVRNTPVKTNHSIGRVECYYRLLQQVYSIVITEISDIKPDLEF